MSRAPDYRVLTEENSRLTSAFLKEGRRKKGAQLPPPNCARLLLPLTPSYGYRRGAVATVGNYLIGGETVVVTTVANYQTIGGGETRAWRTVVVATAPMQTRFCVGA
jgi:hypothetical protein